MPRGQLLGCRSFQHLDLHIVTGGPDVLDIPGSRRDECTICTAVARNASSPCAHTGTPGHSTGRAVWATSAIANGKPAGQHPRSR